MSKLDTKEDDEKTDDTTDRINNRSSSSTTEMECKKDGGEKGNNSTEMQQRRREERKLACFKCNEEGHLGRDCPNIRGITCYICKEFGHTSRECGSRRGGVNKNRVRGNVTLCYNCGKSGHKSWDCQNSRSERRNVKSCFNCRQAGHLKKDCPQPRKNNKPLTCLICQETGHSSRYCTKYDVDVNSGGSGDGKFKACSYCHREGHLSVNCKVRAVLHLENVENFEKNENGGLVDNNNDDDDKQNPNLNLASGDYKNIGKDDNEDDNDLQMVIYDVNIVKYIKDRFILAKNENEIEKTDENSSDVEKKIANGNFFNCFKCGSNVKENGGVSCRCIYPPRYAKWRLSENEGEKKKRGMFILWPDETMSFTALKSKSTCVSLMARFEDGSYQYIKYNDMISINT